MSETAFSIDGLALPVECHVELAPFTTMGVGGAAKYFVRVGSEEEIPVVVRWARTRSLPVLVLGEGSNMVVADGGFPGLVLKMEIPGIRCIAEDARQVEVAVGAGETWDAFVEHTVENGWWGIENMSLIPGTVGAVAVQNVSAYGQEVRRVITRVRAYDTQQDDFVELSNEDCGFGFRASAFNTTEAGRYIIVATHFRLGKEGVPVLARRQVRRVLKGRHRAPYTQQDVRQAIIHLRTCGGLLPPPETDGNSGTFFRSNVIPHAQFRQVFWKTLRRLGWAPATKLLACRWRLSSAAGVIVPSRMLIRACNLQHVSSGPACLFPTNCAVLINSGGKAQAADVVKVIQTVRKAVYENTDVVVSVEPTLVGFLESEIGNTWS